MTKHKRKRTKPAICEYLLGRELDKEGICPLNHNIEYFNGWFRIDDGNCFNRPDLTAKADWMIDQGYYGYYHRPYFFSVATVAKEEDYE